MKLILEETFALDNVVELNESNGQKTYVIKGTFSTPDKKNRNGRIYASKLWEDNVAKYQTEIQGKTTNTLMEKEHPPRTTVDPWSAVAQIRKLEMREGLVYGEAELLNIPETAVMRELIDKGIKIGVSSRGVGKMKGDIVEEFNLITYDIVSTPSDYNANLQGFNESMILEGVEIEINEKGQYICTPEGCSLTEGKHGEDSDEVDDLKSDEEGIKSSDEKNKEKTSTAKIRSEADEDADDNKDDEDVDDKEEKKMKEPQSECDKKAKKLAEAFRVLAKGDKLSEDEIKFNELKEKFDSYMGIAEGSVKKVFGGYNFEFTKGTILMSKDKKMLASKSYPSLTSVQMKAMISDYEKTLSEADLDEGMKVNTQAICDQAKLLSPQNQAKVFALVLSLQD